MYYPLHCLYLLLISYQMTMCTTTTIDTFSAFFHSSFPHCLAALRCLCGSGLCRNFFLSYFACCFQSFVFRFVYTPVSLSLFFIICVLTLLCPLLLVTLMYIKVYCHLLSLYHHACLSFQCVSHSYSCMFVDFFHF